MRIRGGRREASGLSLANRRYSFGLLRHEPLSSLGGIFQGHNDIVSKASLLDLDDYFTECTATDMRALVHWSQLV